MREKVKTSIIIPVYNQKECLQTLLPNLADQTFKDFEVILVDDCSPDETIIPFIQDFIKDKPYMQLVRNTVNMRFVKTCNRGITLARGENICLLNSDTEIRSSFVQRNIEIMDSDETIGGITCIVIDKSGQNWFTGGRYRYGVPTNLTDDFQGLRSVDFIAGTAAFYRKDVFKKIGLFDENYIMYHEDIEFGLRMSQQTEYRMCCFSDKLVTHLIVPSLPLRNMIFNDNRNLVMLSKRYAPVYLPNVLGRILWNAVARLIGATLAVLTFEPRKSLPKLRFAVASIQGAIDGLISRQTQ